jgi:hypothetical protein
MVPTSGFELCHSATLVRSRSVSEKRPVAIIWILWGCPAGHEAGPIVTEIAESVGDGVTSVGDGAIIGFDWLQAQLERTTQTAEALSGNVICPRELRLIGVVGITIAR